MPYHEVLPVRTKFGTLLCTKFGTLLGTNSGTGLRTKLEAGLGTNIRVDTSLISDMEARQPTRYETDHAPAT